MAPPSVYSSHHDALLLVERARARVTLAAVADAFIASLAVGQLDLRSALGSYVIARHLPQHPFTPTALYAQKYICGVCGYGQTHREGSPLDLAEDDVTRQRFGVLLALDDPTRLAADLDLSGAGATRASIEKAVAGVLKAAGLRTNTYQRRGLLDVLGWCDVQASRDKPGFLHGYVPFDRRPERNEWGYPLGYWTGTDGVNREALREVIGTVELFPGEVPAPASLVGFAPSARRMYIVVKRLHIDYPAGLGPTRGRTEGNWLDHQNPFCFERLPNQSNQSNLFEEMSRRSGASPGGSATGAPPA